MFNKIIPISFLISLVAIVSCKKKANNDDQAAALALLLTTNTSATCTSESPVVTISFLNNIPTLTQANINFSQAGVSKFAGIQAKALTVNRNVAFKNTGNIIISVNKTSECKIVNGTTPVANPVSDYTLTTTGSNYTYRILAPGDYVFILQTPTNTDTNTFTVGLE